jgi:N-acetylglucosaminyl-diphospho-decaprenol L-rhamnosyltransferase
MYKIMKDVTLSIVSMNNEQMLSKCINSIIEYTIGITYEIHVVAYLFNKNVLQRLKDKYPDVVFIINDEITGFSANNNLILKNAQSQYTFVVNDDTYFTSNLLRGLIDTFEQLDESTAIISPVLYYPDGRLQFNGREKYTWVNYLLVKLHLEKLYNPNNYSNKAGIYQSYNISGACFLIKTDIMKKLGYFDESYFFCPEDIALSTKANEEGYKVYVNTDLSIIHVHEATSTPIKAAISPVATKGTIEFLARNSTTVLWLLRAFTIIQAVIKIPLSILGKTKNRRLTQFRSMYWTIIYTATSISNKSLFINLYKKVIANKED